MLSQLPIHQIENPERLQVFVLDEVFTDEGVLTYQANTSAEPMGGLAVATHAPPLPVPPSVHGSSVELRERGLFLCILRFQVLAAFR